MRMEAHANQVSGNQTIHYKAAAPLTISIISLVMEA
jgi:hypothetical protein